LDGELQSSELSKHVSYYYVGAHEDSHGRGFVGFRSRVERRYSGSSPKVRSKVEYEYDLAYDARYRVSPFAGMPSSVATLATGAASDLTRGEPQPLQDQTHYFRDVRVSASGRPFVVLESTDRTLWVTERADLAGSGQNQQHIVDRSGEELTYDAYGNVLGTANYHGVGQLVVQTTRRYAHQNDSALVDKWLISLPIREEHVSWPRTVKDENGTPLRVQPGQQSYVITYDYDTLGRPTKIGQWGAVGAGLFQDSSTAFADYDSFGNPQRVIQWGAHAEEISVRVAYDSMGVKPIYAISALHEARNLPAVRFTNDARFGIQRSEHNPDGSWTIHNVDGLGRPVEVRSSTGQVLSVVRGRDGRFGWSSSGISEELQMQGQTFERRRYDAFGRVVFSEQALHGQDAATRVLTGYTDEGQVAAVSQPFFGTGLTPTNGVASSTTTSDASSLGSIPFATRTRVRCRLPLNVETTQ
jgi:hypothetical protein